ncbi:MAG TPA: hypothetical protein VFB62_15405 [Polyangiaceae bacterium]|jgi:hypothetical protein|nr:hypothetical protein [Polyangiaceae bacterium]
MGEAEAQQALYRLTAILESDGLPYAIIGAFALNEYGHRRVTVDVDLVMRDEDLQEFKRRHLGKGYAERTPGTGKLLDTTLNVNIGVLSTGRYPGDDKPKPIAFPDPATTAVLRWICIPGCATNSSNSGSSRIPKIRFDSALAQWTTSFPTSTTSGCERPNQAMVGRWPRPLRMAW